MRGLGWALGAVIAIGALAAPARAQTDEARYRAVVREALEEFDQGNFEEALTLFQQAFELRPGGRVLRGIAKTRFELRQYVECLEAADAALAATVDPLPPELAREVTELRDRAARYVGSIVLRVVPDAGAILLDGRELGREAIGTPIRVAMGSHELEGSAEGFLPGHRTIDVEGGATVEATLELEAIPVAAAPAPIVVAAPPPPAGPDLSLLIAGAVVGAVGAVGVGVGIPWVIDRQSGADLCTDAPTFHARCLNGATIAGERDAALGTTIASSVLLAAGVTLIAIHFATAPSAAGSEGSSGEVTVACAPTLGGAACGGGGTW